MMEKQIEIVGVRLDNFSTAEIKEKIVEILRKNPEQKFASTLNPEILLKAYRDEEYKRILTGADLNICDGVGLRFVSFFQGRPLKSRFTGVDLTCFLLKMASEMKLRVLVIAAQKSLSKPDEIEQAIREKYPNISVRSVYFLTGQSWFESDIIEEAEIVFLNFGAPKQERFISENRLKFAGAKILVGVGGSFDFITGKIYRAPRIFCAVGLEWLWRLSVEPKRLGRIWNAVVVFPIVALFGRSNEKKIL